jgi:hypothetical protein
MHGLIGGLKSNPWFGHAEAAFWLALKDGKVVGRISAQVDSLVIAEGTPGMGPGTGHWGMFECIDDKAVADALFAAAEDWLRAKGMTRAMGPFSLSIWDEPGLLVQGFDGPPTVMMGHHLPCYERLVTADRPALPGNGAAHRRLFRTQRQAGDAPGGQVEVRPGSRADPRHPQRRLVG